MEENKYKDALERAKSAIKECGNNLGHIKMIESIFPELGESEDERIRRFLHKTFTAQYLAKDKLGRWHGEPVINILSYLEKVKDFDKQLEDAYKTADEVQYNRGYQDAMEEKVKFVDVILDFPTNFERQVSYFAASILNKEYDYTAAFIKNSAKGLLESAKLELEKQGKSLIMAKSPQLGEQKSDNKVESKFHEGDWVVWDNKITCHIDKVYHGKESLMYAITDTNNMVRSYSVKGFDNNAHLWSIADAKRGDVLAEDSCIFIIQKLGDNGTAAKTYCTLYNDGDFDDGSILYFDIDSTKPATKEQRELFFRKMVEEGYEWNVTTKELSHKEVSKKSEQYEPTNWTEEDESMCKGLISYFNYNPLKYSEESVCNWLKSIKERLI